MNRNERENFEKAFSEAKREKTKRTLYDGIRISKRGMDITVMLLSLALISLLIFALSK